MTREVAIDNLKADIKYWENTSVSTEHLYMAIEALEQEPCGDVISRDMALEKMADYVASGYADSAEDFEEYSRIICQLPSVTQKSGKWIDREVYDADRWKCSACGRTEPYREDYCPNCGAKMVEPQESEDKE